MSKVFPRNCLTYSLRNSNLVIRFGKLYGSSKFGLGEEWMRETGKRLEAGLSCYFIKERVEEKGTFSIQKPSQRQAIYSLGSGYLEHMIGRVLVKPISKGEIYVIKTTPFKNWDEPGSLECGKSAGPEDPLHDCEEWVEQVYGSDGEPLLDSDQIDENNVTQVDLDTFLTKFYLGESFTPVGDIVVVDDEEEEEE